MSVALIAHYLGPRLGIGQYIDRLLPPLVEELTTRGETVKILSSPNALLNTPAIQKLRDQVQVLDSLDYSPTKRYLWFAMQGAEFFRQHNINRLVWLSNPIVFPWHPPTIAVIHDVNEWKAKAKYGSQWKTALRSLIYLDSSLTFARKIIVVSQATERDLTYFRPKLKLQDKLYTIPNGTDSQLVDLPSVTIPAPTVPFLLSVGRIDPAAKQLPAAVQLVEAMREISGEPWELHLVGGMNASTQAAGEEFLASVQALSWVHYHGHVEDRALAEWYRQSAAVVFLSDHEGFGLPIAEAAALGRWPIVSQKNQASVEAGGTAVISVDPTQSQEAAAKVLAQLHKSRFPLSTPDLPLWRSAAAAYAREIISV